MDDHSRGGRKATPTTAELERWQREALERDRRLLRDDMAFAVGRPPISDPSDDEHVAAWELLWAWMDAAERSVDEPFIRRQASAVEVH